MRRGSSVVHVAFARDSSTPTDIRVCNKKKPPTDATARGIDINKQRDNNCNGGEISFAICEVFIPAFVGRDAGIGHGGGFAIENDGGMDLYTTIIYAGTLANAPCTPDGRGN